MNKTWKPIVAGVLDIIIGVVLLPFGIWGFLMMLGEVGWEYSIGNFAIATIPLIAFLAIIGGKNHVRRTKWPLAMAGSVVASLALVILALSLSIGAHPAWSVIVLPGIAAIMLTVLSKKEFE